MTSFDFNISQALFSVMVSFRLGAFLMSSPISSYVNLPQVKVLLSVFLGFLIAPVIPFQMPPNFGQEVFPFFYAALTETLVGLMLGFGLQILFMLANVAGEFAGVQIGFSMASLFDPSLGQLPLLAFFYRVFLLMAFFMFNMHHDLLLVLARTYESIPVGMPFFSLAEFIPGMLKLFTTVFLLALRLGLPIIAIILLLNITIGIVTMTAPQMNFYFNVSFIVNIIIGMSLVALGFITLFHFFESGMGSYYHFLNGFFP